MGLYENNEKEYYSCLAASYLRGRAFRMGCTEMLPLPLLDKEPQQLTEEEKAILTDAAKIFVIKGEPVSLVRGEIPT